MLWAVAAEATPLPACPVEDDAYSQRFAPFIADGAESSCQLSWIQNNRLFEVVWEPHEDDYEVDFVHRAGFPPLLRAQRPPHLVDVDQDGWADLGVFTLIGMVNGDYDIFRYDPSDDAFAYFGTMNGAYFVRDQDHLIAIGRSSAAASGVDAYQITGDGPTPAFGLYVDAGRPVGPEERASCAVSVDGTTHENPAVEDFAEIYPTNPDLIFSYCNLYADQGATAVNLVDETVDAQIVPTGTVFHCTLEGGTHAVTITQEDGNYIYSYGPVGGEPELVMERPAEDMVILPDNGAGPTRFGEITFHNGAYEYTTYYSYDLAGAVQAGSPFTSEMFERGLHVVREDNQGEVVFQKTCILATSFDKIAEL